MEVQTIKVAARIRPPLSLVTHGSDEKVLDVVGDATVRVRNAGQYVYDVAFADIETQERIFNHIGRPIVAGCVEGYNGTIFAYGQTGSGKTFTMVGPAPIERMLSEHLEQRGLIPRASEMLFELLGEHQDKERGRFMFEVKCSFVQIYKERIYDLLDERGGLTPLSVHADRHGTNVVKGAVERVIGSADDVFMALVDGLANRRVAETAMNAESSRSHAILTLSVCTTQVSPCGMVVTKRSYLNLVDLAGSERQKDAKSAGERIKEAASINSSLLMLGRVIRALSDPDYKRGSYIAYRDSVLTFLLRDSLGGNAQTAVVVTLHPNKRFVEESISTLRFAQDAKKVKNRCVVNEDASAENVEAWKAEIHRLKEKLREYEHRQNEVVKVEAENDAVKKALMDAEAKEAGWRAELEKAKKELLKAKLNQNLKDKSFATLRQARNAPDELFSHIEKYRKYCEKKIEEFFALERRQSAFYTEDLNINAYRQLERAEVAEAKVKQLEEELQNERAARHDVSCRFEQLERNIDEVSARHERRLSVLASPQRFDADQRTPKESRKQRRMTRFTMGTGSHSRSNQRSTLRPVLEPDEVEEVTAAASDLNRLEVMEKMLADEEQERLKLELRMNALTQMLADSEEARSRLEKEGCLRLQEFVDRNAELEGLLNTATAEQRLAQERAIGLGEKLAATVESLRQSEEAVRTLQHHGELQRRKIYEFETEQRHMRERIETLEEEKNELYVQLQAQKVLLEEADSAKKRLSEVNAAAKLSAERITQVEEKLQQKEEQLLAFQESLESKEKELSVLSREMVYRAEQAAKANSELEREQAKLHSVTERLEELRRAQIEHEEEIAVKRARIEEVERKLQVAEDEKKRDADEARRRAENLERDLRRIQIEYNAIFDAAMDLATLRGCRKSQYANALDAIAGAVEEISIMKKMLQKAEEEKKEISEMLQASKENEEAAMEGLATAVRDPSHHGKSSYLARIRNENYELRNRVKQLEKEQMQLKGLIGEGAPAVRRGRKTRSTSVTEAAENGHRVTRAESRRLAQLGTRASVLSQKN